jgi:hypothetical protein
LEAAEARGREGDQDGASGEEPGQKLVSKETYTSVKRDLLVSKETYTSVKRDLHYVASGEEKKLEEEEEDLEEEGWNDGEEEDPGIEEDDEDVEVSVVSLVCPIYISYIPHMCSYILSLSFSLSRR